MAITATFRFLIRAMQEQRLLPQGGRLLEIGEANWYGKIQEAEILADIERYVDDPARRAQLVNRVNAELSNAVYPQTKFDIVKVYYDIFFSPSEMVAIDLGGTANALRFDLNQPVDLPQQFDVVINHGTAEHIFRAAQVFQTMHDYTAPGGLMIHESPLVGMVDHGFYNLLPGLFVKLAERNQYQLLGLFVVDFADQALLQIYGQNDVAVLVREGRMPPNATLLTAMRKGPAESPFRLPVNATGRRLASDRAEGNADVESVAISSVQHSIVRELFRHQLLPQSGAVLTLGQACWNDDLGPESLADDVRSCVADPARQAELLARLAAALSLPPPARNIEFANIHHEALLSPREMVTIDDLATLQHGVNQPLAIDGRFDVVINYGAAERAFDIGQVFLTMHDRTVPGGLMLHQCAFNLCAQDGYYTVQPTLFFDLAAANRYRVLGLFVEGSGDQRALQLSSRDTIIELAEQGQIAPDSKIFAVLVKGPDDRPFQIPMQGYYAGTLSEQGMRAWRELR
jgi:hypothetical protein